VGLLLAAAVDLMEAAAVVAAVMAEAAAVVGVVEEGGVLDVSTVYIWTEQGVRMS
jgi:cytidine deaminase